MADDWKTDVSRGGQDDDDDQYELTAEEAFAQLSPAERKRLGRMMKNEGRKRDVDFQGVDDDDDDDDNRYDDPKRLAKMARRSKKKDPGMLGGLIESFTGGGGGGGRGGSGGITDVAMSALKKLG
jgi:hypothetical protein